MRISDWSSDVFSSDLAPTMRPPSPASAEIAAPVALELRRESRHRPIMDLALAIDHVQVAMPVGGEAEARAFFGGLLGLAELPKPADMAARGGCWFALGDRQQIGRAHA